MNVDESKTVVVTTEDNVSLDCTVGRIKQAGVACQVQSMSVWQYGLPRTVHEVAVARADVAKAQSLLSDLPQPVTESGVTAAQRAWIIWGLTVIVVVAIVRLVMTVIGN